MNPENQEAMMAVERELQLAGTDPKLRKRWNTLEDRRITPEKEIPPMEFLFELFNKPCFPRGELVAMTGKAKSGKTFMSTILMEKCLTGEGSDFIPCLRRVSDEPKFVKFNLPLLFGDALPNGLELDEQALMQKVMDLVSMTSPKLFYSVLNKAVKEGVVSQLLDNFNRKRYSLA